VTKHFKGDKHQSNMTKIPIDPNHNLFDAQPGIEGAFKNERKITHEDEDRKKDLLDAQIKFAAMVAHHNILSTFNSCFLIVSMSSFLTVKLPSCGAQVNME
jgi:hypothetical protein